MEMVRCLRGVTANLGFPNCGDRRALTSTKTIVSPSRARIPTYDHRAARPASAAPAARSAASSTPRSESASITSPVTASA